MLSYVVKHSKLRKTSKLIKLQWIASIWCQNDQKSQNYKSNQIPLNLHRFDFKTIKILRYVAKLQKWSNYNELHWFDVKTIKTFELRRKTFKTTQNYKTGQITMNCIDLMSKRSKMLRYVAKLQKKSNYNELHRFDIRTI